MSVSGFMRSSLTALIILVWIVLHGASVQAQQRAGSPQADKAQPVNSGANPYRVIRDWAQLQLGGKTVGRIQWRGHRSGWQVRVGDRPMLTGDGPGLSRHQGESSPPFR